MNGVLAQIIALTAYGNDFLQKGKLPDGFYPDNTTFRFCNKIDFREFKKPLFSRNLKETIVAESPIDWLKRLNKEGCKMLRLYYKHSKDRPSSEDHKLAGFVGGGGSWLIEAVNSNYSKYWSNRWQVTKQNDPNQKIWTVNYGVKAEKQQTVNLQIDQIKMKAKLKQTLTDISDFAYTQNLESWGKWFENAKTILESENPGEKYYHKDLIPAGNYSTLAKQLLFSASSAWAFGGMGSWNDLGFDNQQINKHYNELSELLYSNINDAIISAINSY